MRKLAALGLLSAVAALATIRLMGGRLERRLRRPPIDWAWLLPGFRVARWPA